MSLNRDGQPNIRTFNSVRNKEKAAYGLMGILTGVVADKRLNEQEILFLDVWLRSQEDLRNDTNAVDLLEMIKDILNDGIVTKSELKELQQLVRDIIKSRDLDLAGEESQINELTGFLLGIAADGRILTSEIKSLSKWLKKNSNIENIWPANIIINRLNSVLKDGIITQEERDDLLETTKQITGVRFEEDGIANGLATEFVEDNVESVTHQDSVFCFTGKFVTGTREAIEAIATNKGAITKPRVNNDLDYLVIGTLASRDWKFSSHGRKIESALELKESGMDVTIITEQTWLKYI